MSMRIPLTPAGIEPATFRFVAQHLNHCANAVPNTFYELRYILSYMNISSSRSFFRVVHTDNVEGSNSILSALPKDKRVNEV